VAAGGARAGGGWDVTAARRDAGRHPGGRGPREAGPGWLFGRRAVAEALAAGRPLDKLFMTARALDGGGRALAAAARRAGVPVVSTDPRHLDALLPGIPHQGVAAQVAARAYAALDDTLARARAAGEPPLLVALDGVQDPQNLGAVIRCAEAAGAHGLVIPQRHAAGLSAAVARASAGAVEHLPVARVVNLDRALAELQAGGLWVVGADQGSATPYLDADLTMPLVLVLGSEGAGLSRLVGERCDLRLSIPMSGRVASLNVSAAAAVLLYEVRRQRAKAGVS